jgi:AraC-like DNA-binding protein
MDKHGHGRIEMMYVKKGSCKVIACEDTYRLEAGDFIFLNGNIKHQLYVDRHLPCRVICLEFTFRCSDDAPGLIRYAYQKTDELKSFIKEKNDVIRLKDTDGIYENIIEIYMELEAAGFGKEIIIQASLCEMIIKLARLAAEAKEKNIDDINKYVNEAVSYMRSNYHEDISIEMVAEYVNLNTSYFYKIFRKVMQKTPAEYLNQLKISKARSLLERTDIPINDICFYAGFNSRQYFSYAFKKHTGMTPKQYRMDVLSDNKKDRMNDSCFGSYQ